MTVLLPALFTAAAVVSLVGVPAPPRLARAARRRDAPRGARPAVVVTVEIVLAMSVGLAGAAVAALGAVLGLRAWTRRAAARTRELERAGATEALAVLGAELRAGRPPADALDGAAAVAVGPLGLTLAAAATGARYGADAGAVLVRSAEECAVPDLLRGLGACWQVCGTTGSSLAAAVERLGEALRAEQVQRQAVDAELAGPRATAVLLAGLPLAGIALASGLGARPVHVLLHTPIGLACLVVGVGLDLLGVWWTGRLVAAAGGVR